MTTSGASSSSVLLALLITMTLLREVHVPERAFSPAAVQVPNGLGTSRPRAGFAKRVLGSVRLGKKADYSVLFGAPFRRI